MSDLIGDAVGGGAAAQPVAVREKPPISIYPQLKNVVSSVDLGTRIDLKGITMRMRNAEYNPKRFSAVTIRLREPKTTALVFESGKMVITGAKSEDAALAAAKMYTRLIQRVGHPEASMVYFRVHNMLASCGVSFPIRLDPFHNEFQDLGAEYEPEVFPGVIFSMKEPKVTVLIFVSGRVIFTGAKSHSDLNTAFENMCAHASAHASFELDTLRMYPLLLKFRKHSL